MPMETTATNENLVTRQRLLAAAGPVFAEKGFDDATVREICQQADANIAAINYHFGDKQRLYSETLKYWAKQSLAKYPPNMGVTDDATAEQKLAAFIRSFLLRVLSPGRDALYGRLITREMANPTPALATLFAEVIKPLGAELGRIV